MKMYRKKQLQQMFPWEPSVDMSRVSVSQADKDNGSPKIGDMIAVNPSDTGDMWLVAEKFFKDNFEEV